MTRKSPSTDFIPYPLALDHVERREGAPGKRLLDRALADGLAARGYVIHEWPPYEEGIEALDPELFTPYPQAPPARIDERDGSAVLSGWAHPHFECRVLNIEVDKAQLLARWPGKLKPAKSRRQSIRDLVRQAEKSGHRVASVTRDGTTLHFNAAATDAANNPWLDDLKVTKQ